MKKWICVLAVLMLAGPALAQLAGLPVATGAKITEGLGASGGFVIGDDFNLYGVRGTLAPMDGLALFGDAGAVDPDEGDTGWSVQGGAVFTLPLDLPVDLGLRGALGYAGFDLGEGGVDATANILTLNGGLLASKTFEQLTPYAFLGVNYADTEWDVEGYGDDSEDETDLAAAAGLLFALTEQFSLYGEIAYIDDPFFGFGGRVNF